MGLILGCFVDVNLKKHSSDSPADYVIICARIRSTTSCLEVLEYIQYLSRYGLQMIGLWYLQGLCWSLTN